MEVKNGCRWLYYWRDPCFNFYDFGRKGKQPPQYEFFILTRRKMEWQGWVRNGSTYQWSYHNDTEINILKKKVEVKTITSLVNEHIFLDQLPSSKSDGMLNMILHHRKPTRTLNMMFSNRNLLFPGSIFRCHVSSPDLSHLERMIWAISWK